ncbi:MAG: glycosyltransferase [Leptolyngbyaceae cyanobacterium MO_188.B28]|nr:glycosyltransferase [Leptolyngbyaceae cyanobacterium MO_188.B28]
MKIAYLINQYPKVSHSFIRREILGLESSGIEVVRFSVRSCEDELVDEVDKAELEKTTIVLNAGVKGLFFASLRIAITRPIPLLKSLVLAIRIGFGSDRGVLRHIVYLAEACVLLRQFSTLGVSQVHAHFGTNSTTVAMLCAEMGGPPFSFTVHGPEEFDKPLAIALPEKIKRAVFVAGISSFTRSQLYRWCDHEHWAKIHVVHCGVDDIFLNAPYHPISDHPKLVCVGRLCEQKGQLLLIEAVRKLTDEGLALHLVLAGDGPLRRQIEGLIAQFGLHDQIEITGWLSGLEVQQQILNARAMVLPSFAEGLPVVIMEALALGRPVISTYVAGISELVEPGVNGWLTPAGSVEALTQAMRELLQSSVETLEEMGKAGRQQVTKRHDSLQEAKKLATLFRAKP